MKLASMIALALLTGLMLVSCGGSTAGDDAGDTLQGDMVCTAQCAGKECGMDGCGGICGGCDGTDVCDAGGHCVAPCVATCAGMECGDDGCGGTCGACATDEACTAAGLCQGGCEPACGGKQCGPDGCNGTCGSCAAGEACTAAGVCEGNCEPACGGKQCGPDGCDGSCGTCAQGENCSAVGQCEGTCVPECTGKQCGADGCNGSCGTCAVGEACTAAGLCFGGCVADCAGKVCGSDGCGGSCGTCVQGENCAAGQCTSGGGDWVCDPTFYDDGEYCDCECGQPDPDCDASTVEVFGCDAAQTCDATGHCTGDIVDACGGVTWEGCCTGAVLTYCEAGEIVTLPCSDVGVDAVCGWYDGDDTYDPSYNCGPASVLDVTGDPSGTFPMACAGSCPPACAGKQCGDDGCGGSCGACTGDDGCDAAGQCVNHCGGVSYEGCCVGAKLVYCLDGELTEMICNAPDATDDVCGWYPGTTDYPFGYYCGPVTDLNGDPLLDPAGDPSGTWPLTCPGACVPACTDKQCGDDGCGGSCGDPALRNLGEGGCAAGETCTDGQCQGVCQPACTGKACGDDGCGGSCGTCAGGDTCVAGACVAPCDRTGFAVEGDAAAYDPDAQLLVYAAVQPSNPADYLSLELWQRFGGPTTPGSYVLADENYETCATCVLIDTDCTATTCQKTFLATAGGVTLTELGVVGDTFAGTLTNVTLVEVTIDPDTYVSTPVPGGETWCLDALTFDVPIDAWPTN